MTLTGLDCWVPSRRRNVQVGGFEGRGVIFGPTLKRIQFDMCVHESPPESTGR